VILIFENITIEEIEKNRPSIEGVLPHLVKFLGNHKDIQEWDFIKWNRGIALLIPKRYAILSVLSVDRMGSIHLLETE